MFCKQFWTTQHICQFEILANFLYDTVQENNIDYPLRLTWIDNVVCGEDDDLYAACLLFVLTCSKHVCNAMIQSLENFVNSPLFNVDYILNLGGNNLKQEIQHVGMGNKNTTDIIHMFQQIKTHMDACGHFPCTSVELTQYDGVGSKIASLVLYFAYGQIDAIPVYSHVIKCAIALKWVPDFCKSPEAI